MKLHIEISGGFAPIPRPAVEADTAAMDEARAAEALRLFAPDALEALSKRPAGGADCCHYAITIEEGGVTRTFSLDESQLDAEQLDFIDSLAKP